MQDTMISVLKIAKANQAIGALRMAMDIKRILMILPALKPADLKFLCNAIDAYLEQYDEAISGEIGTLEVSDVINQIDNGQAIH